VGEFTFEGGHRDGPSFYEHYQSRQEGLPRLGNPVPLPYESKLSDEHTKPYTRDPSRAYNSLIPSEPPRSPQEDLEELVAPAAPVPVPQALDVQIGMTVWLELSRGGPYKVIGKYEHPLGAEVRARHPNTAPNEYERVRVREDLWLCEDSRGVVHILAAGSLTDREPESWATRTLGPLAWIGRQAWERREIALWLALAGTVAKLALS